MVPNCNIHKKCLTGARIYRLFLHQLKFKTVQLVTAVKITTLNLTKPDLIVIYRRKVWFYMGHTNTSCLYTNWNWKVLNSPRQETRQPGLAEHWRPHKACWFNCRYSVSSKMGGRNCECLFSTWVFRDPLSSKPGYREINIMKLSSSCMWLCTRKI